MRTKLHVIDRINRFAIYDLSSYENDNNYRSLDIVAIKSILVQTGQNRLHEIYIADLSNTPLEVIYPAKIVNAGQQQLIVTTFDDGGN